MSHKLLEKQLRALGLDATRLPADLEAWQKFVDKIDRTYGDHQQEIYLLERSLEISSREMQEQWQTIEAERARSTQAGKLAVLGEMAGGIAHEINNPLAVIRLKTEMIQEMLESDPPEVVLAADSITLILRTLDRIAKIVSGLRTFARVGDQDPFEVTSIERVIEETLSLCSEFLRVNNIQLNFVKKDADQLVNCRSTQISQVLLNLLSNAKDAIASLDEKWIKVEVRDLGDNLEISVTDSGKGISQQVQEKMMQPFFTTKEVGRGTGLGLSISKGIVEGHGGSLSFDPSSPNTRFVLILPKRLEQGQAKAV